MTNPYATKEDTQAALESLKDAIRDLGDPSASVHLINMVEEIEEQIREGWPHV